MLLALLATALAHGSCDKVTLDAALEDGEHAFSRLDLEGFAPAIKTARKTLGCIRTVVSPEDIARYYRLEALDAYLDGRRTQSRPWFRAMRHAHPLAPLPFQLVPRDHPLHADLATAEEDGPGALQLLARPSDGRLWVDGLPSREAPTEHPWLFQRYTGRAGVVQSQVVSGGGAPSYATGRVATERQASGARLPLYVSSLGLGLTSAALYVSAWSARSGYDRAVEAGDEQKVRAQHGLTNGLSAASLGAAGASTTLLVLGATL